MVPSGVFSRTFLPQLHASPKTDCLGTWCLLLLRASAKEVRGLPPTHHDFLIGKPRERGEGTAVEGVGTRGGIILCWMTPFHENTERAGCIYLQGVMCVPFAYREKQRRDMHQGYVQFDEQESKIGTSNSTRHLGADNRQPDDGRNVHVLCSTTFGNYPTAGSFFMFFAGLFFSFLPPWCASCAC